MLVYELEGRDGALEHPLICRARRELLHHKAWPQGDFHQGIIGARTCPLERDLIRKSSDERQHGDARGKDKKRARDTSKPKPVCPGTNGYERVHHDGDHYGHDQKSGEVYSGYLPNLDQFQEIGCEISEKENCMEPQM